MNNQNEPMACKEQEIPVEIQRNETLVETAFESLKQLESKIEPVLSGENVKPVEDEKAPRLESQIGNWLNDQNNKLEDINKTIRDLCRRVRL